jgi:putative Mg2+ transporter-C (MgtC) family protein
MMTFEQMLVSLIVALILGAIMGLEREFVGKDAGIRTAMLVSGGSAIFTTMAINLPYLLTTSQELTNDVISGNAGFLGLIANIVVGIGFIGAGIIIKNENHVYGLTTAAVIWTTASIGILSGLGLFKFAFTATVLIAGLLYLTRKFGLSEKIKSRLEGY